MKYSNSVYPNEEQIKGFLELGPEGPICLVNLLKFKTRAEYEDGRESSLTGREAYDLYEAGITKILQEVGGYIGFIGDVHGRVFHTIAAVATWQTLAGHQC